MKTNNSDKPSVQKFLSARALVLLAAASVLVWLIFSGQGSSYESPLYQPSSSRVGVPEEGLPFSDYIHETQATLREALASHYFSADSQHFGEKYPLERVVSMRAPFEMQDHSAACASGAGATRTGFLLLHGLTDSPYYLQGVARELVAKVPCAHVRAILLPGHGTVPGDTLDMSWREWMAATEYGVESFRDSVDQLYIVGFSLGTALALKHADVHRDDALVKGLILLSPAVRAANNLAYLSPYFRWIQDWTGQEEERDAARYESFSVNAGAQFYLIARQVEADSFAPLTLPVFMVGTIDDTTVNMESSIEFFCTKAPEDGRHMIVYQGQSKQLQTQCTGIEVVEASAPAQRVHSISHTGLTNAPDDPHYGFDADYANCRHYGDDSLVFDRCFNNNEATIYAERNLVLDGSLEDKLIRRGTFNPHFAAMVDAIVAFVAR